MSTKAFSVEDGNLNQRTIIAAKNRTYSDIDLSFTAKPSPTGKADIYKKTDAAAVKQAVKNLLLTNRSEKPFSPYYGGNLNQFLFSLASEFDEEDIAEVIFQTVANFEPRAIVRKVLVNLDDDRNSARVTVIFQIKSTQEVVELSIPIARLR